MSDVLQMFLIILVVVLVTASLAAMLMMFAVFPLINKFFKTHLPSYDYSHLKEDDYNGLKEEPQEIVKEAEPIKKEIKDDKNTGAKNKNPINKPLVKASTKPTVISKDNKIADKNDGKTPTETEYKKSQTKYVDLHKDVPTVRLPPVIKNSRQETLTMAKIDAAARAGITPKQTPSAEENLETAKPKEQNGAKVTNKTGSGVGTVALPNFAAAPKTTAIKKSDKNN